MGEQTRDQEVEVVARFTRFVPWSAALALMSTVALASGGPAQAGDASQKGGRYEPGSSGIGDPYFPLKGNGGYDVAHYDLTGTYTPATDVYSGKARLSATATANLSSFNLDLVGMTVSEVEVNGKPAAWSRADGELVVSPQQKLRTGEPMEVEVTYSGVPHTFVLAGTSLRAGFLPTEDGAMTLGAPDVAAGWFPVNDHPLDKATYTFRTTVPAGLGVVANGRLMGEVTTGDWTTFTWQAADPMASYLATVNIGEWTVSEWTTAGGLPIYNAVDTDIAQAAVGPIVNESLARQDAMLVCLENRFGPYPFEAFGAIVDEGTPFAMETQTRPIYGRTTWQTWGQASAEDTVVHELAHQWFGDDVALARFQDTWLSEGFATYAEWLWDSPTCADSAQASALTTWNAHPASDPFWDLVIADPTTDAMYDAPVYERGAMTLQALRNRVGDDAFWETLSRWASDHTGGHGTTPEFASLAESVSGQDLDGFFDTWLHQQGKPASL